MLIEVELQKLMTHMDIVKDGSALNPGEGSFYAVRAPAILSDKLGFAMVIMTDTVPSKELPVIV